MICGHCGKPIWAAEGKPIICPCQKKSQTIYTDHLHESWNALGSEREQVEKKMATWFQENAMPKTDTIVSLADKLIEIIEQLIDQRQQNCEESENDMRKPAYQKAEEFIIALREQK